MKDNLYVKQVKNVGFKKDFAWVAFDAQDYDLSDYMLRYKKRLPMRIIKIIFYQILLGLKSLHLRGLIHRDIKPNNIFISGIDYPRAKIGDLGHVRGTLAMDWSRRLYTSEVGTLCYHSPEQITCHINYDMSSDIYSLGLVICEILIGERIMIGENQLELLYQCINISGVSIDNLADDDLIPPSILKLKSDLDHFEIMNFPSMRMWSDIERIIDTTSLTHWDKELLKLLKTMLSFNKLDRPTAYEALQHPAFRDVDISSLPK